ncbi:QRFP-like peptide receptor isoform X2 [Palaemon carinicauda]|uniref:QRFP-like peptide receptor isoform X2 n=1 Tax=Palaemon carinicauda TaxID=392227 RepID=UPI0035B69E5E
MDDFLFLRPTMMAATMTQESEGFAPSLAPFFTTPYPEGNQSMQAAVNVSCIQQVNVSEYNYPFRIDTWNIITWKEVLKIMAYAVIFLVSLFGNFLVILVVHYNAHMRTSTNQYLVNLAATDLLVTLVCMWIHIVRHLSYPNYILPELVCRLDGFVQAIALTASVLTLTVISVGRFVAVMFPLHARTSPDRAHRVIAAVWITSALLAFPTLLYRQRYSLKWKNYTSWHCDEIWPSKAKFDPVVGHCVTVYDTKTLFYTAFTIALYFLPVLIMLINYSLVVWRMWMTQLPGEYSAPALNTATRAKKKVVKMVSVVLLVFVLCWTPLQSLILYNNFVHVQHNELPSWFSSMEFAAYFIAYSNSALNPIIYCGFNASFRQGFVALLTCRHSSSVRIYNPRSTLKSALPPERPEAYAGNWRVTTAGTRETTVACSGPEPAILLEFNSTKKTRFGQKSERSPMANDIQNSLSDSGSDSGCKRSTQCETLNESQASSGTVYNSPSHQYHHPAASTSNRPLRGLPLRGFSRKLQRAPLPSFGHMGLSGCCGGKRNGKMKQNLVISGEKQIQAVAEVRDNVNNDTKEDML